MKLSLLIKLLEQYPGDTDLEVEFRADGDEHIVAVNGLREEMGIEGQTTRVVLLT